MFPAFIHDKVKFLISLSLYDNRFMIIGIEVVSLQP
mgnify:FL=1